MPVELDELAGPFGGEKSRRLAAFWDKQLNKVRDDQRHKRWAKRAQNIEKRYRDERSMVGDDDQGSRRYNALWANIEILTPAIYGRCPVPIAERRFRDKDPVGRNAASILERGLRNEIEINGFDDAIQAAVRDYLLVGRGTAWIRYEPEVLDDPSVVNNGVIDIDDDQGDIQPEDDIDDNPDLLNTEEGEGTQKLRQTGDRIIRESVPVDYIHWSDFYTLPNNARTWKEVTAVVKRVFMTRDQMKTRFGRTVGNAVPLRKDERGAQRFDGPDQDPDDKGIVYEIWSLSDRTVYWVAEGYDFLCDRKEDPLQLEGFFPCPRPIYSNSTTSTLVPVPDFIEYQDQAIQIDELTQRIAMLTKACKVAGVYNAAAKDVQRLFTEGVENEMIPVDDWAAFAEEGGVAGAISFIPLKEIMGVIDELTKIKDKCILEMDRLTGITDIMRGTTDARETLGGQRLKTNSSGTRLQRRQNEVARFCRDLTRLIADVMAQHFSPQSLIEVSGALYEEGLGYVDMPDLTALQNPQALPGPSPAPQPAPGMPAGPLNGSSPPVAPGVAPPPPQNVVPFPNTGQMTIGGQPPAPPMPQPDPIEMRRMAALDRIARAIQLIRDEKLRGFRVDIEVDSTISADSAQEKGDRTEFVTAVTGYLQTALQLSTSIPEITPLLGKLLQFGVRGFKVGRDLELAIDEFCDEAAELAKRKAQQAASQPNPMAIDAQSKMMKATAALETARGNNKRNDAKLMMDQQSQEAKIAADREKSNAEVQRQVIENEGEQQNNMADLTIKREEMQLKREEMALRRLELEIELKKMTMPQPADMEQAAGKPPSKEGAA